MIDSFKGRYFFLSNFTFCRVNFETIIYPTVEHAFQAAKTLDTEKRRFIQYNCRSAADAKRYGRSLALREDWEGVKVDIMRNLLRKKFAQPNFQSMLLATGDEELVEGNTWGDTFWGVCNGEGENVLGKLLMEIREEIR